MDQGNAKTSIAIAAIVALVLGGGVGYAAGMNMGNDNHSSSMSQGVSEGDPNSATKAADLRVTLNQMMRQHVTLASVTLKDLATDAPQTEASVAALDANSVELADAVGSVYGDEARDSFLELWRNHIGFFVDYTQGKVAGDQAKMDQARADIDGYTEEASAFFAGANPEINQEQLKEGLATHGNQVFDLVDAYAAGEYQQAFELEEEAYNHIGMAADSLAQAIVIQKPDQF